MKKETKKVTINAICWAILLGGLTLVKSDISANNMTTLYNVQKTTYSKIIDEEGNISTTLQEFYPEYLTLKEIDKTNMLEIESRSNWKKDSPRETHNYMRTLYKAQLSQQEIDDNSLDNLVLAFEQGQIDDLTKVSVEDYCKDQNLSITREISDWHNWTVQGQCNENDIVDFTNPENYAEDKMTVVHVNYDESTLRPATLTEQIENNMPIVFMSVVGAMLGASMASMESSSKEESASSYEKKI